MKKQIVADLNGISEKENVIFEKEKIALHEINVGFVLRTTIPWSIA